MSSRDFANFVELLFFAMLGGIVLSLWFGIVMSFVYNVLKMVFGKADAAASTEPGQSKDKAKKKFVRQADASSEAETEMDHEQLPAKVAARAAVRPTASAVVEGEEPEERPDYSQRMADEFEAHTVTS